MENTLDLKPLRVKILYPGVDYVMVLVDRQSLVNNLKREIQETLGKLFPHTSHGPIHSIRKDNGKVLLPEWYPVDPMLKDEEEVILCYDPLVSDCSPSLENDVYCSKGGQRSDAVILDKSSPFLQNDSIGHSKQGGNEEDPVLPHSMGTINKDTSRDFMRDLGSVRMSVVNAQVGQQVVGRVLEHSEASSVRKRKGEVVADGSHSSEANATLGRTVDAHDESPFKKLKADVIDGTVVSKADFKIDETIDANVLARNEMSSTKIKTDPKKSDGVKEDSEERMLTQIGKKACQSEISVIANITETNNCSAIHVPDDPKEPRRNSSGKKKKHKKKEHKAKKLIEEVFLKDLATGCQDSTLSSKLHKKKKQKKKNESYFDNTANKCKWNESVVITTPLICRSTLGTGKDGQKELLGDFVDVEEEKNVAGCKSKKHKHKKIKERINDKEKETQDDPFCSSSSITVSDLKESGIGSGSLSYGIDKMMNNVSDKKNTSAASGETYVSKAIKFEGGRGPGGSKSQKDGSELNELFGLSQSNPDLTYEDNPQQQAFMKKNRNAQSKQNGNECLAEKADMNEGQAEYTVTAVPNSSKKSKSIENIPKNRIMDNVDENPHSKPSFDYETDAEIKQIQTKIRKVVCEVVEESDYSQSLLGGPLELTIQSGVISLPRDNDVNENLGNLSAVGTKTEVSQISTSVKDIQVQDQDTNGGSKKSSKKLNSVSRKKSLKNVKKGESDFSTKSVNENTTKKQKEISTIKKSTLQNVKNLEEISVNSGSDTSSMSFSDCVSHDVRKNNKKKEMSKKLSTQKEIRTSKTEEKPEEETRKGQRELQKQDDEMGTTSHERLVEKIPVIEKPVEKYAGKETRLVEAKDGSHVETNRNGKSLEKKKKSRRKSRSSAKKSVAKVQDWLSQIAEDVPTETESTRNQDIEQGEDRTGRHCALENRKSASLAKDNESQTTNVELCEENEVTHSKEGGLNAGSAGMVNETEVDNISDGCGKDNGIEKLDTCGNVSDVLEDPVRSPCRTTGIRSYDTQPNRQGKLRSCQDIDTVKDSVVDLKFNALVEDGGSVISSRVTKPLKSRTSLFQKSLTGFLSREDQKRFQSKLQSKTSPTVR